MRASQKIEQYAQKAEQILLDVIEKFCIKNNCDAYLNGFVDDSYFAHIEETDEETIETVIEVPQSLLKVMNKYEEMFYRLPDKIFVQGKWERA